MKLHHAPPGICATLGTAFGAVLFSIEITATAYMVRNLPRAFLTAVAASLVFLALGISETWALFGAADAKTVVYTWLDLLLFTALGVLCGFLGVLFNLLAQAISTLRNDLLNKTERPEVLARRRYVLILVVTAVVTPVLACLRVESSRKMNIIHC